METRETRIGKLEFEKGYLTSVSSQRLYDELDFQRACQAYVWAVPIVGSWAVAMSARRLIGNEGSPCDLVYLSQYEDLIYAITGNVTTPYYFGAYDLGVHGAMVVEDPAGMSAGFIQDLWHALSWISVCPASSMVPGGNLLIVPPGEDVPDDVAGFHVVRSKTNMVVPLLRNLETDTDRAAAVSDAFRVYPYAQRDDPPPTGIVPCEGREWATNQPRGLAYWEALSEAINNESVEERDRFFHAMLKPLGIEKGQRSKRPGPG